MKPKTLPAVEIDPPGPVRSVVVWLHGLGADGHDFEPIVPHLGVPPELGVRFVFPHASPIPVGINMGMVMPAWYDIVDLDLGRRHDEAGILRATEEVGRLLERERENGILPERIVLAGFSQGGAIALHAGLRYRDRLAGILALSCYLVRGETLETEAAAANRGVPIFQAHGEFDPMVVMSRGERARDRLRELGYDTEWKTYPMGHEVCMEETQDIGEWLNRVLEAAPPGS